MLRQAGRFAPFEMTRGRGLYSPSVESGMTRGWGLYSPSVERGAVQGH